MATRKPLTLITGSPNKIQEMPGTDTLDPTSASLTGSFVGTTDTQTLTNKTLSSPKITGSILDANGLEAIDITATIGAVNQLVVENSVGTDPVVIRTAGDAVTGSINIAPKNGGAVQVNGSDLITASSTTTLTNKTHTNPRVSDSVTHTVPFGGGTAPGDCVYDVNGLPVLGIIRTGASGTYLGFRGQVTGTPIPAPSIVACGPDSDIHILMQPKGASGRLQVRTQTTLIANVKDSVNVSEPWHYRALSNPSGASATAVGQQPFGMVSCVTPLAPANVAMDNNVIYWYPFIAPQNNSTTNSLIGFTICTGAANAVASNLKVGIYNTKGASTPYPNDSGTSLITGSSVTIAVPGTADTIVTDSTMTATLTPGNLYWIAFCFETNACIMRCYNRATPRYNPLGVLATAAAGGFFNATVGDAYTGWGAIYTYATLPANSLSAGVGDLYQLNSANGAASQNIMGTLIYST